VARGGGGGGGGRKAERAQGRGSARQGERKAGAGRWRLPDHWARAGDPSAGPASAGALPDLRLGTLDWCGPLPREVCRGLLPLTADGWGCAAGAPDDEMMGRVGWLTVRSGCIPTRPRGLGWIIRPSAQSCAGGWCQGLAGRPPPLARGAVSSTSRVWGCKPWRTVRGGAPRGAEIRGGCLTCRRPRLSVRQGEPETIVLGLWSAIPTRHATPCVAAAGPARVAVGVAPMQGAVAHFLPPRTPATTRSRPLGRDAAHRGALAGGRSETHHQW